MTQMYAASPTTRKALMIMLAALVSCGMAVAQGALPGPAQAVLTDLDSPRVWAPRFGFEYEDPHHPLLVEMRKIEKLDEVVGEAEDDWEIIKRLAGWTCRRLLVEGDGPAVTGGAGADMLKQIREGARKNICCGTYNRVFQAALNAFGIFTRDLNIGGQRQRIAIGQAQWWHAVTDVWSNRWGKWIFVDSEMAVYYEFGGVPLSALEIQQLLAGGIAPQQKFCDGGVGVAELLRRFPDLEPWRKYYLDQFENVDIVMAANHHSPQWKESERGEGAPRLYCLPPDLGLEPVYIEKLHYVNTTEPADLYWPVNVVEIVLPLQGRHLPAGPIEVELKTHTPFPEKWLYRIDGEADAPWLEIPIPAEEKGLRTARLTWELHPGKNTLESRIVSALGQRGRISRAVVTVAGS